ncbi:SRPBCC domain-containing protein [Streptomyces hiroshimensis]|uniref:SRPBCC domain-containing protein n=1 Tax=Streptomyces hiroshimensis TaxID=66424 RepID=A0ABQ2Z5U1_9ACTN|nr:SRPBCC domain-containing protein [Streptomyces hiroshimensis]GGY05544.1 hypothetical protein GCM10010324_60390 [Streptomyces hiroshimensis]
MSAVTEAEAPSAPLHTGRRRVRPRRRPFLTAALLLLAALAGYAAWANLRPVQLTASTEVRATPQQVWKVLSTLEDYPRWNPFITRAEVTSEGGRLREGATLRNRMHDRGGDSVFTPRVESLVAGKELSWLGKAGPGWIVDGRHRFVIERIAPDRVRFTQSERFTGVLVPFLQDRLTKDTLPQFHAMNKALKDRIEAAR